jgi:hypothetical protein
VPHFSRFLREVGLMTFCVIRGYKEVKVPALSLQKRRDKDGAAALRDRLAQSKSHPQ